MTDKDMRFTLREIAEASGLNHKTLNSRAKRFRSEGVFPPIRSRSTAFYSYDQVKKLISKPKRIIIDIRPGYVEKLKMQLQTDGYRIKKEANNGDIPGN